MSAIDKPITEQIRSTPQQRKYLLNRLDSARYAKRNLRSKEKTQEPARVKQARKLVRGWDQSQYRLREFQRNVADREFERVKAIVLFKKPEEALKAVETFEARS